MTNRCMPGAVLGGRFEIVAEIDEGASTASSIARATPPRQLVTIQALDPALVADGATMERLTPRGADGCRRSSTRTSPPPTASSATQVLPSGTRTYIACEYVDGQTLRGMLDKKRASGRAFSLKGAYNVIAHLCNALQALRATVPQSRVERPARSMRSINVRRAREAAPTSGLARALARVSTTSARRWPRGTWPRWRPR